jgi:hypothetical protein
MLKGGPGDPVWGWKMLIHDLRNPEQPEPVTISNIVNYPPQAVPTQLKRFNFASVMTIILTVSILIIAGVLLWKTGAIEYLIETCRSLMT